MILQDTKAIDAPISDDIALSAEYLALNVLNSGEMEYAKKCIAAALAAERRRCARILGASFPQAEDERVESAIEKIEKGTMPW